MSGFLGHSVVQLPVVFCEYIEPHSLVEIIITSHCSVECIAVVQPSVAVTFANFVFTLQTLMRFSITQSDTHCMLILNVDFLLVFCTKSGNCSAVEL